MKKINPILLVIVSLLFVLSIIPGQGTKAANQQAIVGTEYTCTSSKDCPVCVGSGIEKKDTESFLYELNSRTCVNGKCQQSDACLVWDCGNVAGCNSIKQTILDNTIVKINKYPIIIFLAIFLILIYRNLD
jgi:Na+-transporting methylmalonyl-CoA/oxaloacetate decarboxylase beta subunit